MSEMKIMGYEVLLMDIICVCIILIIIFNDLMGYD